jgi:hypothetical protein
LLILIRVLLLALVVLPRLVFLVSLVLLVFPAVVVSSKGPDTLEKFLTVSKPLLLASLETFLLQLASLEALSSLLPGSTLVVPHRLDSSLLPEDRLCRHWLLRANFNSLRGGFDIVTKTENVLSARRTKTPWLE